MLRVLHTYIVVAFKAPFKKGRKGDLFKFPHLFLGVMRRRSVHFDSNPTIVPTDKKALEAIVVREKYGNELKVEGELRVENSSECSGSSTQLATYTEDEEDIHGDHLGSNLKDMEPELRRSLTNLTFTPIEDPYDNMEAVKSKLVGRDELEIYRMKKLRRKQQVKEA